MPDLAIASIDLSAGLKLKMVYLPPTNVDVVLKNPPADLLKAFKNDDLAIQKVIAAAFASLKASKKTFQSAMADFDAKFEKEPLTNEKDLAARAETMQVMYKQIANAQGTTAAKAAESAWQVQVAKNAALKVFRLKFLANTAVGVLSIAASIAAAALSMGTLAVTILSAAKTLLQMAKATYNFVRDIAKTEKAIIDEDLVIQETWKKKSGNGKIVGRDLVTSLGVPFVKSVSGLGKLLEEYNAKSAKADQDAKQMWTKAKALIADIDKIPDGADKDQKTRLGKVADTLLGQISDLMAAGKSQELFYSTYNKRLKRYEKQEGDTGSVGMAPTVEYLSKLGGLAATIETIVGIAEKLA